MYLWLVGYGAWPAPKRAVKFVEALKARGITRLIDIRLNPCAADPVEGRHYGPKLWNLQAGTAGIAGLLAPASIAYEWLAELGNPQRQDHAMTVLRDHIQDIHGDWPVHRGMNRLAEKLARGDDTIALLCACDDGAKCHRRLVAEAVNARYFEGSLHLREVVESLK